MSRVYIPAELRELVVVRAEGRCEYCWVHQDHVPLSHQADHLIALKHGGQTTEDNLALACVDCNRYKGSDLTSIDPQTNTVVALFNPRQHVWSEHFVLMGARIDGLTPVGRATAALLRFNDRARILQRRLLINAGLYHQLGNG